MDISDCNIVEAHYFRGRVVKSGNEKAIVGERYFEDALTREAVQLHYLPLIRGGNNELKEKGIDVSLALDAYKKAAAKAIDILVLIAGDGDYLPLVRELQSGIPVDVLLLSWDFECTNGEVTMTSQDLLEEVKFPIQMANVIDDRLNLKNPHIISLFEMRQAEPAPSMGPANIPPPNMAAANMANSVLANPIAGQPSHPPFSPPTGPAPQQAPAFDGPAPPSPLGTSFSTQAYAPPSSFPSSRRKALTEAEMAQERISTILSLNGSGGWIRDLEYNNFYFFYTDVVNKSSEELGVGMTLQFRLKYDRIKTEQKDNGEPSYRAVGPIYVVD
jgi:hypothetical protein